MEFSRCINYLLSVSQHEVFQNFSALLSPYGITPAQYGVLNCLWEYDLHTPTEIAQRLCLKTTTISGILDRMHKQSLIDRVLNPNDCRSLHVILTPAGLAMKDGVLRIVEQMNHEIMADFTLEEQEAIFLVLQRISNINKKEAAKAMPNTV